MSESYLILDPRLNRHYSADTLPDLMIHTGAVSFSMSERRAYIKGEPDTVTFSEEYTDVEMIREMAYRALKVLTRDYGWTLYNRA